MKRRDFIQNTGLAGSALIWSPGIYNMKDTKRIGVQLYSVREDMKSDPVGTINKIAKIGYPEVEGFGYNEGKFFGMTPSEFGRVISGSGMKMPGMHYMVNLASWDNKTNQLNDATKEALGMFAEMEVEMIVCPYMVKEERGAESVNKLCDIFNKTGELCQQHGMKYGYHNHDFEFQQVGSDPLIYDMLLQKTSPSLVELELDIYWVVYAGQDPKLWMKKAGGRVTAFHVKDIGADRNTIEVGHGSINFAEIFALDEAKHVKYYIVELEHYKTTPLKGVEASYDNLKKLLDA
jgi:sugar phosphate isomerase/epimerase